MIGVFQFKREGEMWFYLRWKLAMSGSLQSVGGVW